LTAFVLWYQLVTDRWMALLVPKSLASIAEHDRNDGQTAVSTERCYATECTEVYSRLAWS